MNSFLPKETQNLIRDIQKTGARPYSETKAILDTATKKTIDALSSPKNSRFSFLRTSK